MMVDQKKIRNLTAVCLLCITAPAAADSVVGNRFSLSLGAFFTDRDTDTRLDGDITVGTDINFEKDLDIDTNDTVFRIDGYYRFNEKHRLDFSWFDLSRNSSEQISRDIQWGDTFFPFDTVVDTDIDLAIYKLGYTYSFIDTDEGYLGATGGLYIAETRASLEGSSGLLAEAGDLTAPLPVIGLRGEYALSDRWSFRASGEFFFVDFEDVGGSLVDIYAGLDYSIRSNLSLGIGVNSVTIDVDADADDFEGALRWQYTGALLFLKFNF